jgi:hypothetical protein
MQSNGISMRSSVARIGVTSSESRMMQSAVADRRIAA